MYFQNKVENVQSEVGTMLFQIVTCTYRWLPKNAVALPGDMSSGCMLRFVKPTRSQPLLPAHSLLVGILLYLRLGIVFPPGVLACSEVCRGGEGGVKGS